MTPEILSVILWVPFALVVLIAGLIYCISGYRHGLWRALISLAAVILATVLSVLAARLLAGLIAPALAGVLSPMYGAENAADHMIQAALTGVISVALAMVLFGLLLLIFTPILGVIFRKLLQDKLPAPGKTMQWLGLAVGVVSAVMFTLFWLSPLYGSLATAIPVAQTAMQLQDDPDAAAVGAYAENLSRHLLVQVSGSGPVSAVYDGLSSVPVGDSSVSVVEMSQAIDAAMIYVRQLEDADEPAEFTRAAEGLVEVARTSFVDQDWFYSLYRELLSQTKKAVAASGTDDVTNTLFDIADMGREEFKEVCSAGLDFAKFALEQNIPELADNDDLEAIVQTGILQEFGKMLNSSPKMVEIKRVMLAVLLNEAGLDMPAAMGLLEKYPVGQLTDPAQQLLEAECMLLPGAADVPPAVIVLRHPSLGEAALTDALETSGFNKLMGLSDFDEDFVSSKEQEKLLTAVRQLAKLPLEALIRQGSDPEAAVDEFLSVG